MALDRESGAEKISVATFSAKTESRSCEIRIWINSRTIKESIQELLIHESDELTENEKSKVDLLLERFSNRAPFRPLDVFDANFASAASLAGLIITYVIVLLQFKQSDTSA